ncbi:MAG: hypothetical protein ACJ73E_09700 [Mycobacteriales bacterium]
MTEVLDRPRAVPALSERRPPLTRLTALEIRKSLSTRSGRILVGTASVLPAGGATLMFALGEHPPTAPILLGVLGALVGMLLVAVGVLATAAEWTHRTVQTTFLTVPQRSRVLTAKYGGMALLGGTIAAVIVGSTFAVAAVGAGAGFTWAGAGMAAVVTILAGAAMTVVGAGIGAAVANAPAALTGTYLVLLVGITILNGLRPDWGRNVDPLGATYELIAGSATAARPIAVLAGWVLASTVAGALLTRRRAIS